MRAVDDRGRDFLAAVRGQAMQEDTILVRDVKARIVDLIHARKRLTARGCLAFLTHAGPHIRIEHVRILARLQRIVAHDDLTAVRRGVFPGPCDVFVLGLVALRGSDGYIDAQLGAAQQKRMRHVVAIAYERELEPLERALVFVNRQKIRQHLTGVKFVREAVDDRNGAARGELFQIALLERADHNAVNHPGKHAHGVGNRLAAAELNIRGREKQRVHPQLVRAHLKGNAGARGGLCKDHRQRFALEHAVIDSIFLLKFEFEREGETLQDFILGPILKREQMLLGKRRLGGILRKIHGKAPLWR